MWFDGFVLGVGGGLVMGLSAVPGVQHWQVQWFSRRMAVPIDRHGQEMADRVRRRGTAAGTGLLITGVVLLAVWLVARPPALDPMTLVFLAVAAWAGGVAVVEIWRPGSPPPGRARTARLTVPRLRDYLPRAMVVGTWVCVGAASVVIAGGLALTASPWFDTDVVVGGPLPVLAVALAVLAVLTAVAVRRVLATPEPARDDVELYWQDAVRASTLSLLHVPVTLLGILAVLVAASGLDDAASAVAVAQGAPGPGWVSGVLVGLYAVAGPALVVVLAATALSAQRETTVFRARLWDGRVPSGAVA